MQKTDTPKFACYATLSIDHESMSVEEMQVLLNIEYSDLLRKGDQITPRCISPFSSISLFSSKRIAKSEGIDKHIAYLLTQFKNKSKEVKKLQKTGGELSIIARISSMEDFISFDINRALSSKLKSLGIELAFYITREPIDRYF